MKTYIGAINVSVGEVARVETWLSWIDCVERYTR